MKWFALMSALGAISSIALAQSHVAEPAQPLVTRVVQGKSIRQKVTAALETALKDLDVKTRKAVQKAILAALEASGALESPQSPMVIRDGTAIAFAPVSRSVNGTAIVERIEVAPRTAKADRVVLTPKAQRDGVVRIDPLVAHPIRSTPATSTTSSSTVTVQDGKAKIVLSGDVNPKDVIVIIDGKAYKLVPAGNDKSISNPVRIDLLPSLSYQSVVISSKRATLRAPSSTPSNSVPNKWLNWKNRWPN